jgi:predicted anti-sigma-YlaC factor YlaD
MMLNCHDLTLLVTEYLDGNMGMFRRMQFDIHVAMCPDCRRYLDQMKETTRVLGQVPPVALPPEVEAEMLDLFRAWTVAGTK